MDETKRQILEAVAGFAEANQPSGEIDSRSTIVLLTSVALAVLCIFHHSEKVQIAGITFISTSKWLLRIIFLVAVLYSATQLWIAYSIVQTKSLITSEIHSYVLRDVFVNTVIEEINHMTAVTEAESDLRLDQLEEFLDLGLRPNDDDLASEWDQKQQELDAKHKKELSEVGTTIPNDLSPEQRDERYQFAHAATEAVMAIQQRRTLANLLDVWTPTAIAAVATGLFIWTLARSIRNSHKTKRVRQS